MSDQQLQRIAEGLGIETRRKGHIPPVSAQFPQASQTGNAPVSAVSARPDVFTAEPEPPLDEVYHGFVGDYVRAMEPITEAHPLAVLAQLIVAFGNATGRGPHFSVNGQQHFTNENVLIVGRTSRARKGLSADVALRPFEYADQDWTWNRRASGLSSGEGLIHAVRDPVSSLRKPTKAEAATGQTEDVEEVTDAGETDKRLMVVETEAAQPFKTMKREGNTLSMVIRNAFDSKPLRTLTKNSPARCNTPHISIAAHITVAELHSVVEAGEFTNGLMNRFVILYTRRTKVLPYGGELDSTYLAEYSERLRGAIVRARHVQNMPFAVEARPLWEALYEITADEEYGSEKFNALTARAEVHIRRMAMVYALLDGESEIGVPHLKAAAALWEYSLRSIEHIFGSSRGALTTTETQVIDFITGNGGTVTRTEVSNGLFKKHRNKAELDAIRNALVKSGHIDVSEQAFQKPETWAISYRHAETAETAECRPAVRIAAELKRHGCGNCAETGQRWR